MAINERVKKVSAGIFYFLATIGVLDMFVQLMTNHQICIIHSVLSLFFEEAK